jgi:Tol biopolymer transport system component
MKRILIIIITSLVISCEEDNSKPVKCPPYELIPSSPYDEPIWHPNGEIIGFNHTPIREIIYSNGYECPHQATYLYAEDSTGFWLINKDGTNKRRILPYYLYSPSWSPDGKWVAFMRDAHIYKMPFDGESFDTTSIVQLTTEGRNFFPAWSPDGQKIAYDNTDCGSATTPIPPNSCGVLVMDANGDNKEFIGAGRMPYWNNSNENLFIYGIRYNLDTGDSLKFFDAAVNSVAIYGPIYFNPEATFIGFIGNYTNTPTQYLKLFTITPDGKNLKTITDLNIMDFSWSPDGSIVYLNYDQSRIDEIKGTLWIMEGNGDNQRQLTFNRFSVTQ